MPASTATLRTDRLILRPWRAADLEPFAAMNADPAVMEYLPDLLNRDESDALAGRIVEGMARRGWGLWAVEIPDVAPFIGFTGFAPVPFDTRFTPAVEIGWRLAQNFWGKGYATEAARAALQFGFETLPFDAFVSFTTEANARSRAVMTRIGLAYEPAEDFHHPLLFPSHPLSAHVLYRITREEWRARNREAPVAHDATAALVNDALVNETGRD